VCVCVCVRVRAAELTATDNSGASAWDYARARQLHYCMLIVASYLRQRNRGSLSHRDWTRGYEEDLSQPSLFDSQHLQVCALFIRHSHSEYSRLLSVS